ncbi:MAG TPA: hypothetical protein VFI47_24985 [Acidimicrobiales bacterium]|nr:hypothetical protein [Acidimicrobiales bacterium]
MSHLDGSASDDLDDDLAAGRADVTTLFVALSASDPDGRDEEYLAWHSLDHRPELHRLAVVRSSHRLVSTPACRAARAASGERYDAVDHVMAYLLAERAGVEAVGAVAAALAAAGRRSLRLPSVELGVYDLEGTAAARRAEVDAGALPWRPARGAYLLVERGASHAAALAEVPGVAGVWWYAGTPDRPSWAADNAGMQVTYCYLDGDPVETAERLRPVVEARWSGGGVAPLLAAPFHTLAPYDWGRYLP